MKSHTQAIQFQCEVIKMLFYELFMYYVDNNYKICKHPYCFVTTKEQIKEEINNYKKLEKILNINLPHLFVRTRNGE